MFAQSPDRGPGRKRHMSQRQRRKNSSTETVVAAAAAAAVIRLVGGKLKLNYHFALKNNELPIKKNFVTATSLRCIALCKYD